MAGARSKDYASNKGEKIVGEMKDLLFHDCKYVMILLPNIDKISICNTSATNIFSINPHIWHVAAKRTQDEIFTHLEEAKAFASHFKQLRKDRGLTQEDVAFEANVDRVTIARIETARQNFTFDMILSLSKALKVHPKDLFDFILP